MTQHQRALSGLLFDAHSDELINIKHKSHILCQEYNSLPEGSQRRAEIIKELIGRTGENVYFQGPVQFNHGCNTIIGNNFFANFNLTVLDDGPVTVGDHVMIGPNVSIMASSHPLIYTEREEFEYPDGHVSMSEYSPAINIGSHVWIACGCIICGGVSIGDGAVIGAGSVVTHDIPAGYLAFGNPCRAVRPITQADSKLSLL